MVVSPHLLAPYHGKQDWQEGLEGVGRRSPGGDGNDEGGVDDLGVAGGSESCQGECEGVHVDGSVDVLLLLWSPCAEVRGQSRAESGAVGPVLVLSSPRVVH